MTKLVKIGSSYGIRIPKPFIEKLRLKERDIELKVVKNGLLLTPSKARSSWDSPLLRTKAQEQSLEEQSLCQDFMSQDLETKDWEW